MKMVSALPALLLCILGTLIAAAQTNVTTYHYDNARSGQNTKETILTPLNVNSTKFGKKFSVSVDDIGIDIESGKPIVSDVYILGWCLSLIPQKQCERVDWLWLRWCRLIGGH